jgi:hypothetical protein
LCQVFSGTVEQESCCPQSFLGIAAIGITVSEKVALGHIPAVAACQCGKRLVPHENGTLVRLTPEVHLLPYGTSYPVGILFVERYRW